MSKAALPLAALLAVATWAQVGTPGAVPSSPKNSSPAASSSPAANDSSSQDSHSTLKSKKHSRRTANSSAPAADTAGKLPAPP